jgi:hypothetical protein
MNCCFDFNWTDFKNGHPFTMVINLNYIKKPKEKII